MRDTNLSRYNHPKDSSRVSILRLPTNSNNQGEAQYQRRRQRYLKLKK